MVKDVSMTIVVELSFEEKLMGSFRPQKPWHPASDCRAEE
jgi:hypothetical protein